MGLLPYFPLASGLLTGKYRRGEAPPDGSRLAVGRPTSWQHAELRHRRGKLEAFAARARMTLLDVAIGGLAAMPTVGSVIAGATSAEQVRRNVVARSVGAQRGGPRGVAQADAE